MVAEGAHCCDDDDKLLADLEALAQWARRVRDASDEYTQLSLLGPYSGRPNARRVGQKGNWPSLRPRRPPRAVDAAGRRPRRPARTGAPRRQCSAWRSTSAASRSRRPTSAASPASSSSTTCWCWPARCCATPPTVRACGRAAPALPPPAHRRVPGHRSHPDRAGRPHRRHRRRHRPGVGRHRHPPRPPVLRGRPQAVDLPVPAGRHLPVPAGGRAVRRRRPGRGPHHQLPHRLRRHRRRQPRLRHADRREGARRPALAAAVRPVRAGAPDAPGRPAGRGARAPTPTTTSPTPPRCAAREAADVAEAVRRVVAEGGWSIGRRTPPTPDWQPARLGDVTILVPTRTSLPALEDALSSAGISYRAESASLVYASRLVRDLLLTLRAIDDPTDELAVVAALRSPLFGCGDDDLYRFRRDHHGQLRPQPAAARRRRRRRPRGRRPRLPARACTTSAGGSRPASSPTGSCATAGCSSWARPTAAPATCGGACASSSTRPRAWTDATDGTLRQYLAWIRQQTAEGSRVSEAVLPETDDDAVRIMTVHAAKGLEFPVTIVSGMSTRPQRRPAGAEVVWPPGQPCIIKVGSTVVSDAFEEWKPIDEQMSHDERIRLLYVASTRAQDHLIVSLHRATRKKEADGPDKLDQRRAARPMPSATGCRRCPRSPPRPATTPSPAAANGDVGGPAPPPPDARPRRPTRAGATPSRRPAAVRRVAPPARRGARRQPAAPHDRRDRAHRRRPARRAGRPRPAQAPPRPRPPAVAEGPVRVGGRPGGPRRPADHRPRGHGRRRHGRRRGRLAGRGRGHPRPRGPHPCPGRRGAGLADGARGRGAPPLARGLRRGAARRRPHARGLRRPALPARRRPGRGRLQDGARRASTPTSIRWSPATARRAPRTRSRSPPPRASRWSRWCSCSSPPRARSTGRSPTSTPRSPRCGALAEAGDDRLVTT